MSNKIKITEEQLKLIEKLGVVFEKLGLTPAAARIEGLLLVADNTELTFDEIRETLNISKSATSNAINMMLSMDRIEYITKPGDRKRYFRTHIANWKDSVKEKFAETGMLHEIMKEVLQQRTASTKEFNKSLSEFISLFEYLRKEIPLLFKKWEATRK
ncbi:MAG: hypothetical protein JWP12_686 [Bacteroidetes bacterium]|nr:hypothetical protein [Bacteroidota bacterium]